MAACPQRAISLDGLEEISPEPPARGPDVALVCPKRQAGQGVCLQALGLEALAGLWLNGIRRIVAVTADCAACPDGSGLDVERHAATLNALLADRGQPPLRIEAANSVARTLPLLAPKTMPHRGRRAFLGLAASDRPRKGNATALARLQSLPGPDTARTAFAPRIDPRRCTGCDACLRICPETVLSQFRDDTDEISYKIAPVGCSGCGLCMDVCGTDAIVIDRLVPPPADVALTGFRCRGCGVEVHVPTASPQAAGGLCAVCTTTGHHRRLFQVLE